ncbi:hypothetical protein NIES4072_45870 [Nostoc commune NIES-4072]|uniref:Uncharacterized protein n=1 Tax=Nostoc commune NIES-4072 TaxID=2005467 RepID=A0A2R5FRI1_NOSCO|nr:hypothetical protein [Nostoc commune]BBD68101.1 hypothetical protein NIES4070_44960 [Nostoc commune HK-02]GBG20905.1 hypothetical protein NIES4072_45870 [Nostoc commune NIES-4072]
MLLNIDLPQSKQALVVAVSVLDFIVCYDLKGYSLILKPIERELAVSVPIGFKSFYLA